MLRKLLLAAAGLVLLLVLAAAGVAAYVRFAYPKVPPAPELRVDVTPARVARGAYLANAVCVCMDCHGQRDPSRFALPPRAGTLGMGGGVFDRTEGFPGRFVAPNLTPVGLGHWSDGEVYRAITCGVDRAGAPLFPIMPYRYYRRLDPEDVKSIIAYLRSLPPKGTVQEASIADFPMNFILRTIPTPAAPEPRPDPSNRVDYGRYLVNAGACRECHSPVDGHAQVIASREFQGGRAFGVPGGGTVRSANLTPDRETGLGAWDEARFVATFAAMQKAAAEPTAAGSFNTVMPWAMYSKMSPADLGAIFAYLQSLPAAYHEVVKFTPPTG